MTLLLQFVAQNLHFAISLFASLVAFAVFWLIFDAWSLRKEFKELLKWVGFLLLALSFLLYATVVSQAGFGQLASSADLQTASLFIRLISYVLIVIGELIDPLQEVPKLAGLELHPNPSAHVSEPVQHLDSVSNPTPVAVEEHHSDPKPDKKESHKVRVSSAFFGVGSAAWQFLLPVSALGVAALYFRRATTGLEHHLRPVAAAFAWLAAFELISLASLWQNTTNPLIYNWVAPFGYAWILAHLCLLIGMIWLGRWVWQYLVKRLQSQLFMIFTTMTMALCAVVTISFTYLLLSKVQQASLTNLNTAEHVLEYALKSKTAQTEAAATVLADRGDIAAAVAAHDHNALTGLLGNYLAKNGLSSLVITSDSGQVLLRGEDTSRWGQSESSDALVHQGLLGRTASGVVTHSGVLAPVVAIQGAVPIRAASGAVLGVVIAERAIDNAFVDGIKQATGLDSAVYSGNVRASTTLVAPDGSARWVGVTEANAAVRERVLSKGQTFSGALQVLNQPYLAVYAPLRDANNSIVGMLFIGQPQLALLAAIAQSIELTFIIVVALIIVMVIPAYWVAKILSNQIS